MRLKEQVKDSWRIANTCIR